MMALGSRLDTISLMGNETTATSDRQIRQRLRMALDLFETAQQIMVQNLRRRHPNLDDAQIEQRMVEWRHRRPGAEFGDGVGRPILRHEVDAWLASRGS